MALFPRPKKATWGRAIVGDPWGFWAYTQWTWWDYRGERLHFRVTRWKEIPDE